MNIYIKLLNEFATLPSRSTTHAACEDLRAAINRDIFIHPGEREVIPLGIAMELPSGYEYQIRPRSGLAAKHGITVLNSPGTIDCDYRGEIKVILYNVSQDTFTVSQGDRIAQGCLKAVEDSYRYKIVTDMNKTERGDGGFGHTGIN